MKNIIPVVNTSIFSGLQAVYGKYFSRAFGSTLKFLINLISGAIYSSVPTTWYRD